MKETINPKTEVVVQRKWLESLLNLARETENYSKEELTKEERLALIKSGVHNLIGFASSAEFILKK